MLDAKAIAFVALFSYIAHFEKQLALNDRHAARCLRHPTAPLVAKRLAPTGRKKFFENYFREAEKFSL